MKFWTDSWVPHVGCLTSHAQGSLVEAESRNSLSDYVSPQGRWDLGRIDCMLPRIISNRIRAMVPPIQDNFDDTIAWSGTNDGSFSNKSAYKCLQNQVMVAQDRIFQVLWSWKGPERIRCLLWKIAREALLTNVMHVRRGLTLSDLCPVCISEPEDTLHVFRDCQRTKQV